MDLPKLRMSARERAVALVAGLGALGGAVAGATTALLAALVLTPSAPVTPGDIALMAFSYGAVAAVCGAMLGTGLAFAILRRVPLARVFLFGTAGATLGLTVGFLGGPWAWQHFGSLGVGGLVAGALAARLAGGRASAAEAADSRLASWVLSRAGEREHAGALGAGPMQPVGASTAGPRVEVDRQGQEQPSRRSAAT